jgi:hypothetical protein
MARLIPAFTDDSTPPGERDVFNLLAGGPDDWVVLHSLDVAPWNQNRRTEIDFLLIIPETGILCVEVKSHSHISFSEQGWQPVSLTRSPFKQALDARYAFLRGLKQIAPNFAEIPVMHLCIFPRARFEVPPNLSIKEWELIDAAAFQKFHNGMELCADISRRFSHAIIADPKVIPLSERLNQHQVDDIVRRCVPIQKPRTDKREEIEKRAADAERVLRDQQKPVLKLAELNDQVIVSGGAGTGKTMIALEVARRRAERGDRVALLCFNRLVGESLRARTESVGALPNLIVGRAIQVMAEMAQITIPANPSADFWQTILPEQLEARMTDPDFSALAEFDYLVVDEAQDILSRPSLWQCLVQLLKGGTAKGRFALFGDFDHQVLGERDEMKKSLAELESLGHSTRWHLSENCRNYSIVGNTAVKLSGLDDPVYSGYMRTGGSSRNYDIAFYDTDDTQLAHLQSVLRQFRDDGYKPSEISVLSFCSPQSSIAAKLAPRGFSLTPAASGSHGTGYTSVHAFKGMENKVVILTDVRIDNNDFHRDLFYTGMTRAVDSVRVLCSQSSEPTLISWLMG